MMNNKEKVKQIDNLILLIKNMEKPINFTYMDLLDLEDLLKEYKNYLITVD